MDVLMHQSITASMWNVKKLHSKNLKKGDIT